MVYFSFYGLSVWFPDMIKHLQHEEYESKLKVFHREKVEQFHFNFSLENQVHKEGEYINDKYTDKNAICNINYIKHYILLSITNAFPNCQALVVSQCVLCACMQVHQY